MSAQPPTLAELVAGAEEAVAGAERRAGVRAIRLTDQRQHHAAAELLSRVWRRPGEQVVPGELLRAIAYAGNYVAGAYDGDTMVGMALAFYAGDAGCDHVHSHILGVDGSVRSRGVGFTLKLHQRLWALRRGLRRIDWTFDLLVGANGFFNLVKLGAEGVEYLVDFYGSMPDGINAGDETDRVLINWRLDDPRVVDACAGRTQEARLGDLLHAGAAVGLEVGPDEVPLPGETGARTVLVRVPADIVAVRRRDPGLAREWRQVLRGLMVEATGRGLRLRTVTRDGWYVLSTPEAALHSA